MDSALVGLTDFELRSININKLQLNIPITPILPVCSLYAINDYNIISL